MATIKEHVDSFIANTSYTDWDHQIARAWLTSTPCGDNDVEVLTKPSGSLTRDKKSQRETIRKMTLGFIGRYFDERPDVVRSLDALFADFGLTNETARRGEFFPFENIYRHDEVLVLLLKHLQPTDDRGRYTQADIAEYFLTSERTIGTYIRELRPWYDPALATKVFGEIVEMEPERGTNVPESTTHPLFLPLSMVELYTLVDLLARHADDQVEGRIVKSILNRVHRQTTGYAQKRFEHIDGLDEALSPAKLPGASRVSGNDIVFSEKERIWATVRYMDNSEEKTYSGYLSRSSKNRSTIVVSGNDGTLRIPFQSLIELSSERE